MNTTSPILPLSIAAHLAAGHPLQLREEPIELLTRNFEEHTTAVKTRLETSAASVAEIKTTADALSARVQDLEQKTAREPGEAGGDGKSLGTLVVEDAGMKGVTSQRRFNGHAVIERKAITSGPATVGSTASGGTSLVPADRRPEIITPAERRFTIRDLIPATETTSGLIEYPRETGYTNNARPVAEGTAKPYSDITFDLTQAPVRTLAHLFKTSRQILDDAPALAGYIDQRGTYGLKLVEERQVFFGDGTGQNLFGLVPQARAYDTTRTETGDTELDILLKAISQVEDAELAASGIVMATRDWRRILGIKDGDKRYLSNGPFGSTAARIWDLPVYPTNTFATGRFLVGAFEGGAQIFDRMEVEVLVSTENDRDFENNMATTRIEERLAFATYRPEAFVTGALR